MLIYWTSSMSYLAVIVPSMNPSAKVKRPRKMKLCGVFLRTPSWKYFKVNSLENIWIADLRSRREWWGRQTGWRWPRWRARSSRLKKIPGLTYFLTVSNPDYFSHLKTWPQSQSWRCRWWPWSLPAVRRGWSRPSGWSPAGRFSRRRSQTIHRSHSQDPEQGELQNRNIKSWRAKCNEPRSKDPKLCKESDLIRLLTFRSGQKQERTRKQFSGTIFHQNAASQG